MTTRRLLLCGVFAGPIFIAVILITGSLRAGYDQLRHPASSLALTEAGWTQIANFLVTGALLVAFAAGIRRAMRSAGGAGLKPWLVGACGVGLIGAGVFPTDPVSGYPPGTPDELIYTGPGIAHDAFSMLFFLGVPLACVAFARWFTRNRRWGPAVYTALTLPSFIVGFLLASAGFSQTEGFAEIGGLYQRITITIGMAWLTVIAVVLLRGYRAGPLERRSSI